MRRRFLALGLLIAAILLALSDWLTAPITDPAVSGAAHRAVPGAGHGAGSAGAHGAGSAVPDLAVSR
jgi:hypothetical protein